MKSTESFDTRAHYSPMYPEEASPHALAIISSPQWKAAIHNRLNEALYGQRAMGDILFPHAHRDSALLDNQLHANVFAHEEAVRIDRTIAQYRKEYPNKTEEQAYAALQNSEALQPPVRSRIVLQERLRSRLLLFADALERLDIPLVEKRIQEWLALPDSEMTPEATAYVRDVLVPLLDQAFDVCVIEQKHDQAFELFNLKNSNALTGDEHHELFLNTFLHSVADHVIGGDEVRMNNNWVQTYEACRAYAVNKGLCSAREFNRYPEIRKAAEDFLLRKFHGGIGIDPFHRAMGDVIISKIMTSAKVKELPSILGVAAAHIAKCATDQGFQFLLRRYVRDVGIGSVDYFRHHPLVKDARERAGGDINENTNPQE